MADFVPVLSYISCAMIGFGMVPCAMLPLYGLVLTKSYPSRYLTPGIIALDQANVLEAHEGDEQAVPYKK